MSQRDWSYKGARLGRRRWHQVTGQATFQTRVGWFPGSDHHRGPNTQWRDGCLVQPRYVTFWWGKLSFSVYLLTWKMNIKKLCKILKTQNYIKYYMVKKMTTFIILKAQIAEMEETCRKYNLTIKVFHFDNLHWVPRTIKNVFCFPVNHYICRMYIWLIYTLLYMLLCTLSHTNSSCSVMFIITVNAHSIIHCLCSHSSCCMRVNGVIMKAPISVKVSWLGGFCLCLALYLKASNLWW